MNHIAYHCLECSAALGMASEETSKMLESDEMLPSADHDNPSKQQVTTIISSEDIDTDPDIQDIYRNMEARSKQRGNQKLHVTDRPLLRSSSGRKYEKYNHMGDVVDEVLTFSGMSLQEISRLNESYIETAERSAYGTLQKVNDYRVLAELARGSFGIVYLVEDDKRRRYAMKAFPQAKAKKTFGRNAGGGRMPPGGKKPEDEIDLIRREIALMKKLNHPYIVRLYEVVEERIYPHSIYLILEYVNGGPIMILHEAPPTPGLTRDLSIASVTSEHAMSIYPPQWESSLTGGVLGEALASKLFRQLISAMQYLHINAVAHRDLKPENILVTLDGNIKVVDFGVSYDFGGDNTSGFVRDTKGSWPFWAPEMIDNQSANAYSAYSADVWAAGVCLWIFIYGTLPFWAPGPSHLPDPIFDQILASKDSPPKFPSRRSPELCELLLDIFISDPNKRPSFKDLSNYVWIQQHSQLEIENTLNAISSVSIDCSDVDAQNAVTPGEVNFLSENAKTFFVNMARRIREKVKARHQHLIEAKDEEIETKREEMRHYDPIPTNPPPSTAEQKTSIEIQKEEKPISSSETAISRQPVPRQNQPQSPTGHGPASPQSGSGGGVGLGRDFSKQSNWTSQSDFEGIESKSLTTQQGKIKEEDKGGSCCNIQ